MNSLMTILYLDANRAELERAVRAGIPSRPTSATSAASAARPASGRSAAAWPAA